MRPFRACPDNLAFVCPGAVLLGSAQWGPVTVIPVFFLRSPQAMLVRDSGTGRDWHSIEALASAAGLPGQVLGVILAGDVPENARALVRLIHSSIPQHGTLLHGLSRPSDAAHPVTAAMVRGADSRRRGMARLGYRRSSLSLVTEIIAQRGNVLWQSPAADVKGDWTGTGLDRDAPADRGGCRGHHPNRP